LIDPQSALEACRLLHNASLIYLWGTTVFLGALVPRALAETTWQRFGHTSLIAAAVAVLTTVVRLPLEAGFIGDGWQSAIDPQTVHDVLFETTLGRAWQMQAVAAAVLIVSFVAPKGIRIRSIAVAAALNLASLALSGHAAMNQGWVALIQGGNDIMHILSGGAWLGALLPLVAILGLLETDEYRASAQTALRRFSIAGHAAVALVIISGMANTVLVLHRLPTDWSSPYQRLLALKIALVTAMVGLAIANRYLLVPWIGKSPARAIKSIKLASLVEIALGLLVLALVAVFGALEPV
jgi:putative copper resistance protein D